ncbi:benzoate/H(+) symporter BenE family transporter [Acinetobacter brisouii]
MIIELSKSYLESLKKIKTDFSLQALVSGVVAVVVGYAGPTVLVFSVAESANISNDHVVSWLWSYSIMAGLTTIIGSLLYRIPIITAWSTPGIAFLISSMKGVSFSDAIGAFIVSNILISLIGFLGLLEKIMKLIPLPLASALNGGILLYFGFKVISYLKTDPFIVSIMILIFFIVRKFSPRWSVTAVFLVGIIICFLTGQTNIENFKVEIATPIFTMPTFNLNSMINISIPLTILALTGQYIPGLSVLKTSGYEPPINKVVSICGVGSILSSFFGCHNINPSSMIAAIVAGEEAHPNKSKRYIAAISAGIVYIFFGIFAATFLNIFISFPKAMIATLAGLALLTAILASFKNAFSNTTLLSPLVVFIVAASGIGFWGIGSAFWAILAGMFIYYTFEKLE